MAIASLPTLDDFPQNPPRTALPNLTLHESVDRNLVQPAKVIDEWISALHLSIREKKQANLCDLFVEESWWRDLVGFGWNTTSKYGPAAIAEYVLGSVAGLDQVDVTQTPALSPRLEDMGPYTFIQAGFTFVTKFGSGRGLVRLISVGPDQWKAWTVSTELERLKHRDMNGSTATNGNGHAGIKPEDDLQVLVIGAGQCGVAMAAQLQHLGLPYLLVEKYPRLGDSWRNRYDTLTTHTPSNMDHFPFLKFPTNWPKNMRKDQLGEWIECYSRILELNTVTSTQVKHIERNEKGRYYTVELNTNGDSRTITTRHIVLSTGQVGEEPVKLDVPGQDTFRGIMYHSFQHKSALQVSDVKEKRIAIVGTGNSAHDIAQDYVEQGAKEVTLIQRHPNIYLSSEALETYILALWNIPSLSVEDADLVEKSMPFALALTLAPGAFRMCALHDEETLNGLQEAGMALRKGEDGISFLDYLVVKGGHYYIEQGAGRMIVDGKIKVKRCSGGVKAFYDAGIELADGTRIESDVIVTATGGQRNGSVVEPLFGKDVAEKAKAHDWGSLDEESEFKGWWRPTGVPGLWCMSGALGWSRQYSGLVAMQIEAIERGYNQTYYDA